MQIDEGLNISTFGEYDPEAVAISLLGEKFFTHDFVLKILYFTAGVEELIDEVVEIEGIDKVSVVDILLDFIAKTNPLINLISPKVRQVN